MAFPYRIEHRFHHLEGPWWDGPSPPYALYVPSLGATLPPNQGEGARTAGLCPRSVATIPVWCAWYTSDKYSNRQVFHLDVDEFPQQRKQLEQPPHHGFSNVRHGTHGTEASLEKDRRGRERVWAT